MADFDFARFVRQKSMNLDRQVAKLKRHTSIKMDIIKDDILIELDNINEQILMLKDATTNIDNKIKEYFKNYSQKIKDDKKYAQNALKLIVQRKYSMLKLRKDKYLEIQKKINDTGLNTELENEIETLKKSEPIITELHFNYNDNNTKSKPDSLDVSITDYKINKKTKVNEIEYYKDQITVLNDKLKDMTFKLSVFRTGNIVYIVSYILYLI